MFSYYPQEYLKDLEYVKNNFNDCLCGRSQSLFVGKLEKENNFTSVKNFILVSYELNIIAQIVYTHFHRDFEAFKESFEEYLDSRCSHQTNPVEILKQYTRLNKRPDNNISRNKLLESDTFFLDLIKEVKWSELKIEELRHVIKNDSDINNRSFAFLKQGY